MPSKSRLFAAIYDRVTASAERSVFPKWRRFIAGEAKGRILEIGAGTGANLPYYPKGAQVTVIEPNPHMLKRLKARAERLGVEVVCLEQAVERLPFPDASFDTVVITLVLCSVDEPEQSLHEIARVLAKGGELRFMEHVRSERGWRRFQDVTTPLWRRLAGGCHPNRNTVAAMKASGFDLVDLHHFTFGPYPVRPHLAGVAKKAA
jgi:ubiquinone/menaquinone biosynthesis C-methylase UbiE